MPSSHLILCHPFLLLSPIPPIIRVFSNESALRMRWPKYWSFSFSISPSSEHPGLISFRMDWLDLLAVQGTFKILKMTPISFLLNLHKWNFDWLKFQMVEVVYPLTVSFMALLFQLFQINSTSIQVPEVKASITVKQLRMPALEADCLDLNFCCPT